MIYIMNLNLKNNRFFNIFANILINILKINIKVFLNNNQIYKYNHNKIQKIK